MNLINANVALPMNHLEEGLKAGKIIVTWKHICAWLQPAVTSDSEAQDMPVELPLKIVAPLFMAARRPAAAQKKISINDIPDVFSDKAPAPEPKQVEPAPQPVQLRMVEPKVEPKPVAPVAQKEPAPVIPMFTAPVAPAKPVAPTPPLAPKQEVVKVQVSQPAEVKKPAVVPETKPGTIGEIFGKPEKQDWSPNDIVKNLATLPGIAGAFIAMQDGLLVSAELPSHLKADTVAAFLPQIFGRMNQYSKELQLGAVSSLGFVAENVSWQIVKSGTIYLVALGKTGESLPGSTLNVIAAELGRQIQ
jgi:predicted regulator of Ras-like GTPase activity (Roadblock/LC7/MglB family)